MIRKTIHLGDDRFAFDQGGEVYKNGYGLVPKREYLIYSDGGEKKKISMSALQYMLFEENLPPKKAVTRVKLSMAHKANPGREKIATKARMKKVYCLTERRRFRSVTSAAEHYGIERRLLSGAIIQKKKINGLLFRPIL